MYVFHLYCISLHANALEKNMNFFFSSKLWVNSRTDRALFPGMATCPREGKLEEVGIQRKDDTVIKVTKRFQLTGGLFKQILPENVEGRKKYLLKSSIIIFAFITNNVLYLCMIIQGRRERERD